MANQPDRRLREVRASARRALDQLWESGLKARRETYLWASKVLDIPGSQMHIGILTEEQCRDLILAARLELKTRPARRFQTHELKSWPSQFRQIILGLKPYDLRRDIGDVQPGDLVIFKEWDPTPGVFTGQTHSVLITYVTRNAEKFGLLPGFVIVGWSAQERDPMEMSNFEHLHLIKRKAAENGHQVLVVDQPRPGFPDGKDVLVNGQFHAWFASIEEKPTDNTEEIDAALEQDAPSEDPS